MKTKIPKWRCWYGYRHDQVSGFAIDFVCMASENESGNANANANQATANVGCNDCFES